MDNPTKPAGCLLQVIGGAFAIYAAINIAFQDYEKVILFGVIGIVLLVFGRRAIT